MRVSEGGSKTPYHPVFSSLPYQEGAGGGQTPSRNHPLTPSLARRGNKITSLLPSLARRGWGGKGHCDLRTSLAIRQSLHSSFINTMRVSEGSTELPYHPVFSSPPYQEGAGGGQTPSKKPPPLTPSLARRGNKIRFFTPLLSKEGPGVVLQLTRFH